MCAVEASPRRALFAIAACVAVAIFTALGPRTTLAGPGTRTFVPLAINRVPATPGTLAILSSTASDPSTGSTLRWIAGEIVNDTAGKVRFVKVKATLRGASGEVVGGETFYVMIQKLKPGMSSPFRWFFPTTPEWTSYDLEIASSSTTTSEPYPLQVLSATTQWDITDSFHVTGQARNQYAEARDDVQAYVTVYDAVGKVLGVESEYAQPRDLGPGQQTSFDVGVGLWKGKPDRSQIRSYRLQVLQE